MSGDDQRGAKRAFLKFSCAALRDALKGSQSDFNLLEKKAQQAFAVAAAAALFGVKSIDTHSTVSVSVGVVATCCFLGASWSAAAAVQTQETATEASAVHTAHQDDVDPMERLIHLRNHLVAVRQGFLISVRAKGAHVVAAQRFAALTTVAVLALFWVHLIESGAKDAGQREAAKPSIEPR
jgi:hypothetical protein